MATKINKKMNQRGQVAIFIILGIVLVVGMIILFLLSGPIEFEIEDVENPQAYIGSCVKDSVEEAVEILLKNAGDIKPNNTILYLDEEITYLCYTNKNLEKCVAEEPVLIMHMETEITDYITPIVETCFNTLETELEDKKYDIEMKNMKITTQLQTRHVVVNIDRDFKMTKNEQSREFKNFKMTLVHPIYDLSEIAIRIVDNEASYCTFNYMNHMLYYPKYDITMDKTHGEDDVKIYSITDLTTQKKLKFAVRGCVMPKGLRV